MTDSLYGDHTSRVLHARIPSKAANFVTKCSAQWGVPPSEMVRIWLILAAYRPEQLAKDFYRLCGLPKNATPDEVRTVVRRLIAEVGNSGT